MGSDSLGGRAQMSHDVKAIQDAPGGHGFLGRDPEIGCHMSRQTNSGYSGPALRSRPPDARGAVDAAIVAEVGSGMHRRG